MFRYPDPQPYNVNIPNPRQWPMDIWYVPRVQAPTVGSRTNQPAVRSPTPIEQPLVHLGRERVELSWVGLDIKDIMWKWLRTGRIERNLSVFTCSLIRYRWTMWVTNWLEYMEKPTVHHRAQCRSHGGEGRQGAEMGGGRRPRGRYRRDLTLNSSSASLALSLL